MLHHHKFRQKFSLYFNSGDLSAVENVAEYNTKRVDHRLGIRMCEFYF